MTDCLNRDDQGWQRPNGFASGEALVTQECCTAGRDSHSAIDHT